MKRSARNIFCMLSLLVFVSSVAIWVRSYFVDESFYHLSLHVDGAGDARREWIRVYGLAWNRGVASVHTAGDPGPIPQITSGQWRHTMERSIRPWTYIQPPPNGMTRQFAGFTLIYWPHASHGAYEAVLDVPLWFFLPAGIPPLLWWRKYRRRSARGFPVEIASSAEEFRDREDRQDAKGKNKSGEALGLEPLLPFLDAGVCWERRAPLAARPDVWNVGDSKDSSGFTSKAGDEGRTHDIHVGKVFHLHSSLKDSVWYPPTSQKPPQRDTEREIPVALTFGIPRRLHLRFRTLNPVSFPTLTSQFRALNPEVKGWNPPSY